MAKLQAEIAKLDDMLANPTNATFSIGQLAKKRDDLLSQLDETEAQWIEWSEQLEG
jgi:hypothetical protein